MLAKVLEAGMEGHMVTSVDEGLVISDSTQASVTSGHTKLDELCYVSVTRFIE